MFLGSAFANIICQQQSLLQACKALVKCFLPETISLKKLELVGFYTRDPNVQMHKVFLLSLIFLKPTYLESSVIQNSVFIQIRWFKNKQTNKQTDKSTKKKAS